MKVQVPGEGDGMNRFIEMTDSELSEALENTIISIESSDGAGDWLDAVIEARRRLSMRPAAQTFYVIKRDEEPRYWSDRGWSNFKMLLITGDSQAKKFATWVKECSLGGETARIVKVEVKEIEG